MTHQRGMRIERTSGAAIRSTPTGELSDIDLVSRVRAGHGDAFEILMRRYNRRLFRVARSVVRNDSDAEDIVQDAYIRAYMKIGDFVGPDGFGAWLTRITFNEALGLLRRERACIKTETLPSPESDHIMHQYAFDSGLPDPRRLAESGELRKILETTIQALPPNFRAVFVLRAVEGLSVAETADSLGIPKETVKTRHHRARRLLQDMISTTYADAMPGLFTFDGERCDRVVAGALARIARCHPAAGSS